MGKIFEGETMDSLPFTEGFAPFGPLETWYRITGDLESEQVPLVVVHGGPGMSHDYLLCLTELGRNGRPVIHYDQVGGGRSTHAPDKDPSFWTPKLFVDELDNLLYFLGVADEFDLLGQSWGGMLAAEYAVTKPRGLRRLIISNSPASMPLWIEAANQLRSDLPADVRATLLTHEADGTTNHPNYEAATQEFYDRHLCRVIPNPPELTASTEQMLADPTVYFTMNGPNEFHCIGTLKEWSIIDRLPAIEVPTLVLSGAFDEAQPICVEPFVEGITGAKWVVFEASSHTPFLEEPEAYLATVNEFLEA
jgi:L-proline amide hydrolase